MHDLKERLAVLWIFALFNYLYADVVALFAIVGSRNPSDAAPHLTQWALQDAKGTTFFAEFKAITLMRWIRKAIEDKTFQLVKSCGLKTGLLVKSPVFARYVQHCAG